MVVFVNHSITRGMKTVVFLPIFISEVNYCGVVALDSVCFSL